MASRSAVAASGIGPGCHVGRGSRCTRAPVDNLDNPQGSPSSSAQGRFRTVEARRPREGEPMATYEVILKDRTSELIDAADAYQQEGQMTTFFATGAGKQVVDCWSTR